MISPEDLRIGNFVKVSSDKVVIPKGKLCEVVGIDSEQAFLNKKEWQNCFNLIEKNGIIPMAFGVMTLKASQSL